MKATPNKKKQFIEALEKSLGVVTSACKKVNITRRTYYNWIEKDEKFKQECEAIQEIAIDFVESKLFENIQRNDTTAMIFYLKTKAKSRGYIEKQQIEHNIDSITIKPYEEDKGNNKKE